MSNTVNEGHPTLDKYESWRLQLLEQIFDNACDAIFVADEKGRLQYINEVAKQYFAINPDNICISNVFDFDKRYTTQQLWKELFAELSEKKSLVFDDNIFVPGADTEMPVEKSYRLLEVNSMFYIISTLRDISKRKHKEQELKTTNQKLESIFNELSDVLWSVLLPDFKMLFVTPSVESLYEIDMDEWLKDSTWWTKLIHPDDAYVVDEIFQHLSSEGSYAVTYRICTPGGKTKWVFNKGKYIYDDAGLPVRIDGIVMDRTTQHNTQAALDEEMKLQEVLIDIASTYINIDPQNVVETINDSLRKMGLFVKADRSYVFDYDFEVETTSNTFEWCNTGIEPEIQNLQDVPMELFPQWIAQHRQGLPFIIANVSELDDDESADLKKLLSDQGIKSLIAIPMLQGKNLVGFVGFDSVSNYHSYSENEKRILFLFGQMLINIRYRQKLDNQLRIQEEKYRNIITNMNLGLLESDNNNIIQYANQSFCDMSGYTLEELKGKDETTFLLKEEYKTIVKKKNMLRKNSISDGYEVEVVDKHGIDKWWFISGAPNYNDKGQLIGTIGIHLDISSQKQLESELAQAKTVAEAASKSKELFLANMSHEIRTPLNVIIGMIRQLAKDDLTANQSFYVKRAEISAKHLLTILNNVLDIAKIESGDMQIISQPFSISALMGNAHSLMVSQVREKNLEFTLHIDERIHNVHLGDETRLMQVLINLLGNAVKFTEQGRIELNVELINETEKDQKVRFEVNDSGVGMSKTFINQIFDKFSQENSASNRKYEGTGLGMAISNDLIKLMGGEMNVQSIKNIGTSCSFELTMPIAEPGVELTTTKLPKQNYFKGMKALLVEDNDMNRFIAVQSLDYLGFKTDTAENGKTGVDMVRKNAYDLILMDIQMPVMDGVEATVQIRETLGIKTPIVALTANAFKKDIELYIAKGMDGFIIKPYDENDFFRSIDKAINHSSEAEVFVAGPELSEDTEDTDNTLHPERTHPNTSVVKYDLSLLYKIGKGNQEFVNSMIKLFISLVDENVHLLKQAREKGDHTVIRSIAHKMKPSIVQMGVESLREVVISLEKFEVKEDNVDIMEDMVDMLVETLVKLTDELRANHK